MFMFTLISSSDYYCYFNNIFALPYLHHDNVQIVAKSLICLFCEVDYKKKKKY